MRWMLYVWALLVGGLAVGQEMPLDPVLKQAEEALKKVGAIQDYRGQVCVQEPGRPQRTIRFLVRHRPFAVYTWSEFPDNERGQEALYRAELGNAFYAHEPGRRGRLIAVTHPRVMEKTNYPITQFGLYSMTNQLLTMGRQERNSPDIEVKRRPGEIGGRAVEVVDIIHTKYQPGRHRFWTAIIAIDKEWGIPVHYGAWGRDAAGQHVLLECYTFSSLKLNAGTTDVDFSHYNPRYRF